MLAKSLALFFSQCKDR